ncbi:MAG TPA: Crp/Fnr family transcriptional regulator [Candidatus Binatia bacterium]|nr:Crp/Fnr family transcriptional regulator [Candidatus Binatia bacterium]
MRKILCESCPTRAHSILCDLAPGTLGEFTAVGASAIYRPRQVVFAAGGPSEGLHLVCHGRVKLFCSDRFGHEHVLSVAGPGAVLGELSLDGEVVHAVSAEAVVESQLCFLPRDRLVRYLEKAPSVAIRLVAALSGELARARRHVRDLALKGAESRLAAWLLELADGASSANAVAAAAAGGARPANGGLPVQRVGIPFSRREIAEMIGVSTETAIRLLARLRERGAIAIERHAVAILDAERLARIARHDEVEA